MRRVRLPVLFFEDAAEEVTRNTFSRGGGEFARFPRLPTEIQGMIWKATIKPKTFSACAVSEGEDLEWLLLECSHYRRTHVPISRVCRRSRAVAVVT